MFFLAKPANDEVVRFIEASKASGFSYPNVGGTIDNFVHTKKRPDSRAYNVDHNRIIIGKSHTDLEKAKYALRNWKMFDFGWLELCWPSTPIKEGETVAVLIRHFGFYSLNAARIVYVIDEPNRFGFAYGTLAEHGECGEERFSVEFDETTGEVWYDLFAFSKPKHFLAQLGYPLVRNLQKQFALDSKAAMLRAVQA